MDRHRAGVARRVALVGTRESLLRMLRVTGLGKVLPSFESIEAAYMWLERQAPEARRA